MAGFRGAVQAAVVIGRHGFAAFGEWAGGSGIVGAGGAGFGAFDLFEMESENCELGDCIHKMELLVYE